MLVESLHDVCIKNSTVARVLKLKAATQVQFSIQKPAPKRDVQIVFLVEDSNIKAMYLVFAFNPRQ